MLFMPDAQPAPYWLGVFHYFDSDRAGNRHYHHFAYKMAAQPPFGITSFSKELPLRQSGDAHRLKGNFSAVAFVSGLEHTRDRGGVMFAYGSHDASARVLVASLAELDMLFAAAPNEMEW